MDLTSSSTTPHSLSPQQRREVIALILTMTQSTSASRSDLSAVRNDLNSISVALANLTSIVSQHTTDVSRIFSNLSSITERLDSQSSELSALKTNVSSNSANLQSLDSRVSSISVDLAAVNSLLEQLSGKFNVTATDVANLQAGVSTMAAKLSALDAKLSDATQRLPQQVSAPLIIDNGSLSLRMNSRFCRDELGLNSYGSQTLLQTFNANVVTNITSTNLSTTIIVHSRGSLSTFNLTSSHAFTPSSTDTQLTLKVHEFKPVPSDWSVLLAKPAFQASDFLGYAWAKSSGVWSPISLIGRVGNDPKVITLHLGTSISTRIEGLVLTFSIDT
nr:cell attachment protein [Pteropine orthoreovirus]BAW99707.1 cell attachment protein [Pteropine orthoreovirus]BAW99719.1 cell attachment protein [Pteropine orthoreovirus]BAW99731.1 cell attachment protein [Pteropine orthoreovirus]BAW99743.1 cell attachment protein [Pteropine orthoreovirus]